MQPQPAALAHPNLSICCSLDKKCRLHLVSCCAAAKWTDHRSAVSPLLLGVVCHALVSCHWCLRGSSFLHAHPQSESHPVIMVQRCTHYVGECVPPLERTASRLGNQIAKGEEEKKRQTSMQIRLVVFLFVNKYCDLAA